MQTNSIHRSQDPLHVFIERRTTGTSSHPVPLQGMDFDIAIEAGLAVVKTSRDFRNVEEQSIEATLTFPVPIHATLFDLRATIGGRVLIARAKSKVRAREEYEDAIDRGKSAVIHEEMLRGIHMLSIAHIPPGEKITVETKWAMPLTVIKGEGHLRIPITVGEIYGRSPLADSDDLAGGGDILAGKLTVKSSDSSVRLVNGQLRDGEARIDLNRPIDLVVAPWRPREIPGLMKNGTTAFLRLSPADPNKGRLDLAILIDHSGSMAEAASAGPHPVTKHDLVTHALRGLSDHLSHSDFIDIWEFDTTARNVGSTGEIATGVSRIWSEPNGRRLKAVIDLLSRPAGGTEIGNAIERVTQESTARAILVITDGKSHAIDIQALARKGRQISCVLIGEDSLEANIGHLAAVTGGHVFVSGGADIIDVLKAAVDSARGPEHTPKFVNPPHIDPPPGVMTLARSGVEISVKVLPSSQSIVEDDLSRAVAAVVTAFQMPFLDKASAAEMAEVEGIVSHLTSLILVDEAGGTQKGLPAQRKVRLPDLATSMPHLALSAAKPPGLNRLVLPDASFEMDRMTEPPSQKSVFSTRPHFEPTLRRAPTEEHSLDELKRNIDWRQDPNRLLAGDISLLPSDVQRALSSIAKHSVIMSAALKLGISPVGLILALIAHSAGQEGNRVAARIARTALKSLSDEEIGDLWLAVTQ